MAAAATVPLNMPEESAAAKTNERNPKRKAILIGKKIDEYDLKRMPKVLRSKFAFYLEPPSYISEAQAGSRKRLQHLKNQNQLDKEQELLDLERSTQSLRSSSAFKNPDMSVKERERLLLQEKEKHERLIGQLKAAEARNRTRLLHMRYINLKEDETEHLVDSQPTALKAVRLEAFLPNLKQKKASDMVESLNPIHKRRLEAILDGALLIERKLN